jgi:uncharacterized protein with GYD domain
MLFPIESKEKFTMANYLLQVTYTPAAMAAFVANPQNRIDALKPVFKKLGGKMTQAWFAFGEYDIVGIMDLPDNVSAAAFSFAVTAGGAIKAIKTTPLMSVEEGLAAMKKAAEVGYKPPQ